MGRETPCHYCTERTETCHSTCEKYLEFYRKSREREKEKIYAPAMTAAHIRWRRIFALRKRKWGNNR